MKHYLYNLAAILIFNTNYTIAKPLTYTIPKQGLKTSLIIPCSPKHAIHLYPLLRSYERQTVLPDEAIISLSESNQVASHILNKIKNEDWAFPITLICSKRRYFAGPNRNRACARAIGDIFLCQDADDLAHPQRVEIVKYFFEHHDIVFLMHTCKWLYAPEPERYTQYNNVHAIEYVIPKRFNQVWSLGTIRNGKTLTSVHNGNIAISKKLFKRLQWPTNRKGQDVKFNAKIFETYRNRYVIKAQLTLYRNYLSSWTNQPVPHSTNMNYSNSNQHIEKKYNARIIYTP